ncbi:MAG: cobalamin-binding protein [Thermoleophilia bacterium]|nr:cobalamin-binding protein [Thermoleophilia bacterium]
MAQRIASLLPSVTEIACALGLGDRLVARSHECDYPPQVENLPAVTAGRLPPDAVTQAQVDQAVTEAAASGEALYEVDGALLASLAPDLVLTQSLCDVCAVDEDLVRRAVRHMDPPPPLVSLAPGRLDEVIASVGDVAHAAGVPEAGDRLIAQLAARLDAVRARVAGRTPVRVAAVEWLDPPWSAGHWVPDQVAAAGGEEVLIAPGARSARMTWDQVAAARPDVVVLMPCGLSLAQVMDLAGEVPPLPARVAAVDASGLFSRPGPRLVDGVEVLEAILHPQPGDAPPGDAWAWVDQPSGYTRKGR